jgi:hypothetical protein
VTKHIIHPTARYATLNRQRGVATIGVLVMRAFSLPDKILCGAHLTVDLFFIPSGFVQFARRTPFQTCGLATTPQQTRWLQRIGWCRLDRCQEF